MHGVQDGGDQGQRLAVPDREAVQGEHREPRRRQGHGAPTSSARCGSAAATAASSGVSTTYMPVMKPDTLAGRVGQAGRLQDLAPRRRPAEQRRVAAAGASSPPERTGEEQGQEDRGDGEADGQEVQRRDPVEQVLDQEERRSPGRGDRQQGQGGQERDPAGWSVASGTPSG